MDVTPEQVFKTHYGDVMNPATPVAVEYGWVQEGSIAYELSTNKDRDLWGITVVAWDDGMTVELEMGRYSGRTEGGARAAIQWRRSYYQYETKL